jgi:hypothetical protein
LICSFLFIDILVHVRAAWAVEQVSRRSALWKMVKIKEVCQGQNKYRMQNDCAYGADGSTLKHYDLEMKSLEYLDEFLIYYQFVSVRATAKAKQRKKAKR